MKIKNYRRINKKGIKEYWWNDKLTAQDHQIKMVLETEEEDKELDVIEDAN